ncbi:hypothetical protein DCC81_24705 [Chitinophaga parva]|uniref:Uncharacterized protein n=1 Tax=Chitinophaga parva TaxID=2169414 RepID=A0A2T7BBL9_9BACT|nr:hypothetical protein DCC81_24705 [Chitinophaga parva]
MYTILFFCTRFIFFDFFRLKRNTMLCFRLFCCLPFYQLDANSLFFIPFIFIYIIYFFIFNLKIITYITSKSPPGQSNKYIITY